MSETAAKIGNQVAKKFFEKRSRKGHRNVEVHLTEDELASLVSLGIELALKESRG